MLISILCFGCKPIGVGDIAGTYVRNVGGVEDRIELRPDGTFQQSVLDANGNKWTVSGAWIIRSQVIELDNVYSTFDIEQNRPIIPPMRGGSLLLEIQHNSLARNETEPKWLRK